MDDMEKMENDNIIVLTDEDGTDVEFEFCASIEYEGNEYVVLLPTDDDGGAGASGKIFAALGEQGINVRMISQGPDELNILVGVDDEDVLQKVFDIFKEQAGDEFDFDE